MKKTIMAIAAAATAILIPLHSAWSASSMTRSLYSMSKDQAVMVVKIACTAHTDGTFDSVTLAHSDIFGAGSFMPYEYKDMGYYLVTAWAVNPAATYPTSGAVTITSATGLQLIGSSAGDTLTLSTSASGVAQITNNILPLKRPVADLITIAVSDTGSAANQFTLYLLFSRPWSP